MQNLSLLFKAKQPVSAKLSCQIEGTGVKLLLNDYSRTKKMYRTFTRWVAAVAGYFTKSMATVSF